jgi:multidrug efflux pump subunit AcrB
MNGLIRASLRNPIAVTVMVLTLFVLGTLALARIPVDILPVFRSPAVQTLVFYSGMPAASIEKNITARLERGVVQATGGRRLESRSIVGISIVRDYFRSSIDRSGALTETNALAGWEYPTMPPGTLPPVVLPYDPTSVTPVCLLALDSAVHGEAALFDTGRYEVRPMIMAQPGAISPLVYGGKVRAIMMYLDRVKLQARHLSPLDVMKAVDDYNVFLPTGSAKFGDTDYAIDSNSMFDLVGRMEEVPLRNEHGNAAYLRDVATPKDASYIQTNVVRVNGKRQVYIPVFRQLGASTLQIVDTLRSSLESMKARLTRTGIDLQIVMDQSIYVRRSIESLVEEGVLGAVLCSLVIVIFLGQWRMTAIAVLTIPVSVLAAIACLYALGQTINVMTLAGLALAIGPLVDSAIICLENTHRHLGMGHEPREASFLGASEVAMPELVSTLCTFLVLAPLALMPGLGEYLYRPMAMAVAFAMIAAYFLSRTFVPARCAAWLRSHGNNAPVPESPMAGAEARGLIGRAFAWWEGRIDAAIAWYVRLLDRVLEHPRLTATVAAVLLASTLVALGPRLRREFFPEVDAGAFEVYVRAPSGTRIEKTEQKVERVEQFIRKQLGSDLQLIISELGVVSDLSAAYTPNAGPMDAVVKVQLKPDRTHSAQEYVSRLRSGFAHDPRFSDLEFAFDAGGMIRSALNEGKSSPLSIRISGKNMAQSRAVAEAIRRRIAPIPGLVDVRIIQRLDYPEYIIDVDRAKVADLGLNQAEVMKNVVAALNSSIQFHKKNFWIDPATKNQYFVGVQYPEEDILSVETLLDIPITSPNQEQAIPLRNIAQLRRTTVPTEITHNNLQATIDLTMGVSERDLGHVADDIARALDEFGERLEGGTWSVFDPAASPTHRTAIKGSQIELSGEYARMQETFRSLGFGLILASLLMYFLMAALDKSYVVPFCVMLTVPLCLIGILPMLYLTRTAINVQSLLGVIFIVGIKVANTVLLSDYAQELRRVEGLAPREAIRKAAAIRVRPVTMTALAAFFAMIPMALALGRGSEANAPLGRAILGGLLAGEPATLLVLPALYTLLVRDGKPATRRVPPARDAMDEPDV